MNSTAKIMYTANAENFSKIPGSPIAYWVSDKMVSIFSKAQIMKDVAEPRQGIATGNNEEYLRLWHEIDFCYVIDNAKTIKEFRERKGRYVPYNKGGEYRKWYGNYENILRFDAGNERSLSKVGNHLPSKQYYFLNSITWSFVSSTYFGVRFSNKNTLFDVGGSSVFPPEKIKYYLTGVMCAKISTLIMKIFNPTINFQVGDVKMLPVIMDEEKKPRIDELVEENIAISKTDWDSFETSWGFTQHPLI